jgi:hypothetical protein
MTPSRIPTTGRVRPATLLKLALRRMAEAAILVVCLAVLHELALSNAQPAPPTAATPVAEHCAG